MNDVKSVMSNMYDTLLELRYPAITKAQPTNLALTILSGENRISLLSWLLAEKSETIGNTLKALTGIALEDEILKYYSEIGICTKKELLFGICNIQEQLPTLRLLLDFMKTVHMDSSNTSHVLEKSFSTILKTYMADETSKSSTLCNLQPKLAYADAIEYFERIKQETKNDEKEFEIFRYTVENTEVQIKMGEDNCQVDVDKNEVLFMEIENFMKGFSRAKSWPTSNSKSEKNHPPSLNKHISCIYKQFSNLQEILHIKDEMSKINIPEGIHKSTTAFDSIIQDIVISIEEAHNMQDVN